MSAPAFPAGWFQVAYSDDVEAGGAARLHYFGRELVLFRTEGGAAQVLDAYCAHLGAHLGVGSKVDGDCLRCPFHAWAYDTDGRCVDIPYSERIPKGAQVRAYPTIERSGIVYLWFAADGRTPSYEAPALEEFGDSEWIGYTRHRYRFASTVQDVVENVFDVAHGQFVHRNAQGAAPAIATFAFEGHTATAIFELDLPLVGAKTRHVTTLHGPAIATNRSTGAGTKSFLSTYTPIDEVTVEANFSLMTPRSTPDDPTGERSAASALATVKLFEQDIPIWEHKIYRSQPLLCDGDNEIARYRVWVRQFATG